VTPFFVESPSFSLETLLIALSIDRLFFYWLAAFFSFFFEIWYVCGSLEPVGLVAFLFHFFYGVSFLFG